MAAGGSSAGTRRRAAAPGADDGSARGTPGTITLWSDVACPWATLAVLRITEARARLNLAGQVWIDHRAFPLELVNRRPTPRALLDSEIPVVGAHAEGFGWSVWRGAPDTYPVTTLLAMEAVQAAKDQPLHQS
jgi:predicted DsbA family dithiol-disulfide isomerase